MKPLKLYWSRSKPNFGDAMSPILVERLAGRPVVYADRRHCDLVAMGSLLDRFRRRLFPPNIHVWGTGFIEPTRRRPGGFHYHPVRGRHSAALVTSPGLDVYGDPGLLADLLWPRAVATAPSAALGIVPHYEDRADPKVAMIADRFRHAVIIDVFGAVEDVVRRIAGCDCVLSSSLHGLVVADAFGVPNAWLTLSDRIRGNGFKFRDYYSIYGLDADLSPLTAEQIDPQAVREIIDRYDRPGIGEIKRRLIDAFPFPTGRETALTGDHPRA